MFSSVFDLNTQVPIDLLAESPITSGITFFSSLSLSVFSDFFVMQCIAFIIRKKVILILKRLMREKQCLIHSTVTFKNIKSAKHSVKGIVKEVLITELSKHMVCLYLWIYLFP